MKVCVIGGGSTYTPELIEGFLQRGEALPVGEIALQDVDEERLSTVGSFARRMLQAEGSSVAVDITTDPRRALQGADFVITQIRVGGQAGRHRDIEVGLKHDLIGQETTGVGGFSKALRTIPVVLELCALMEEVAPRAWLINFSNPAGLVTEAILRLSRIRAIGLCNIPLGLKIDIAGILGVEPERVALEYVGLNHLSWVRRVLVDGMDRTTEVLAAGRAGGRPANIPELDYPEEFLGALRMIPSDYLRYYYLTGRMVRELRAKRRSRAEEVMEIEEELLRYYADESKVEKPPALGKRGGAYYSHAALDLMAAIHNDTKEVQIVNARNTVMDDTAVTVDEGGGVKSEAAVDGLPVDAVVEVPCRVDRRGAHPIGVGAVEPEILGLMQAVKAYELLAVEAASRADYRKALLALIAHPLGPPADEASAVLDEIIEAHGLELK